LTDGVTAEPGFENVDYMAARINGCEVVLGIYIVFLSLSCESVYDFL